MGILFTLAVIAIIIIVMIGNNRNKAKRLKQLKLNYEQALKGSNKTIALRAGRAYYSALRENKALTIYDEQAITNDLSTMGSNAHIQL